MKPLMALAFAGLTVWVVLDGIRRGAFFGSRDSATAIGRAQHPRTFWVVAALFTLAAVWWLYRALQIL